MNGTLAVVTSLHTSCIAIAKLANPTHKYSVPKFRQWIDVRGASYSILHQQFRLQLAYDVKSMMIVVVNPLVKCLNSAIPQLLHIICSQKYN